ncbi:MAG: LamG domain-containing protein [Planctomycetota bacterium]
MTPRLLATGGALFLLVFSLTILADEGLVAHYTFDEGSGAVVKDLSGKGHDGAIKGAEYVKSPRGFALRFDGKDDIVDFGNKPSVIVEGDMTLMIWLKTDASVAPTTHRVILGDASGTINRNLSLQIDHQNYLRFEWGNTETYGMVKTTSAMFDGSWRQIAVVCDWKAKRITFYVDAQPFAQGEMPIPMSKTAFSKRFIGYWGYGCFQGEIDDIRLYSRALPDAEIERIYLAEGGKPLSTTPGDAIQVAGTAPLGERDAGHPIDMAPACTMLDPSAEKPQALLCVPIKNRTANPQNVRITVWRKDAAGKEVAERKTVSVPAQSSADVSFDRLAMERLFASRNDFYLSESRPQGLRIAVSAPEMPDARSRVEVIETTAYCRPLRVEIVDPYRRDVQPGKTKQIEMTVEANILSEALLKGELTVSLASRHTSAVVERTVRPSGRATKLVFDTKDIPWGAYDVFACWRDAAGREVVSATALATVLPDAPQQVIPMNNLVTELMDAKERGQLPQNEIEFMNPRDGWCFFSVSGDATLTLDMEGRPLSAPEAMRRIPAGRHVLHVRGKPSQIIVRAIPALIYNVHEAHPHIASFGPNTWERISKTILPSCNIIESGREYPDEMEEWRYAGKQWVTHAQTPGLLDHTYACTVEQAMECWRKNLGYTSPLTTGIQADEVIPGYPEETLHAFARSVGRLREDPKFAGREFIPFVVRTYELRGGMLFMESVLAAGWPFSIELYLPEMPTEEQNRENIRKNLIDRCRGWDESLPGSLRSANITLMYAMMPYCTSNTCPTVDFKVHLDMQMQALATDPLLFGLHGVQPYRSNYVDEEMLRCMGRMLRHYCIEGKTDRLWTDPYLLTHIQNPDFEDGLKSWQAQPAEAGSIAAQTVSGYGGIQGRYPASERGDTVCILKRSAKAPNGLAQEIRNLQPGRMYSLKLVAADHQDLVQRKSRKDKHVLSIRIEGADAADGSFQDLFYNARGPKEFMGKDRYWMNYHYLRFRAKGPTAQLTISDWKDDKTPGSPIGQELMVNWIEVQPYVEEGP